MTLRQATDSQEIILGRFVDATDGDTAETGLTIANTDIKIWKSGATSFVNKNSGGATHIADGWYSAVLDATDTDTVGMMEVYVKVSGALYVRRGYQVREEVVFDALDAPSATLAVGSVSGGVGGSVGGSVGSIAAGGITAASIATGAIDADALATDAVTEIVTGLLTTAMTESYNADGTAPTVTQALMLILQRLTEFAISGTTITVKKLDGSTTAATLTLNDATTPTSSTRAS